MRLLSPVYKRYMSTVHAPRVFFFMYVPCLAAILVHYSGTCYVKKKCGAFLYDVVPVTMPSAAVVLAAVVL